MKEISQAEHWVRMKLYDMFLFGSSFAAVGREGGHYEKSLKWLERHYRDEVSWTQ